MGLKDMARDLGDKAREQAAEHSEKVDSALDRAERAVNERTDGKHADNVQQGREKVEKYLDES